MIEKTLSERKLQVLRAIVDDYITTAVPVGSRSVAQRFGIDISSATIRNEMSDLEEMGYLEQPHTSSGRVPSDMAYRLYVDRLMKIPEFSGNDAQFLRTYFSHRINEVEQVVRSATKIISDLTQYTSVAISPIVKRVILKHIQLVPVSDDKALVVIVTDVGIVKDVLINIPEGMNSDTLYQISKLMNSTFTNKNLTQVRESFAEIMNFVKGYAKFFEELISIFEESVYSSDTEVSMGGAANMLRHPEYSDVERAKSLLSVLETKDVMFDLLSQASSLECEIKIGRENAIDTLKDCSLVTVTYRMGDKNLGKIGVIGPTRMQYSKVLSVLHYMGRSLSEILSEIVGTSVKDKGE